LKHSAIIAATAGTAEAVPYAATRVFLRSSTWLVTPRSSPDGTASAVPVRPSYV